MSDTKKFIENQKELQKVYIVDREQIDTLYKIKAEYDQHSKKIASAILSLQFICTHEYEVKQVTPHFTEEECIHCRKQRNI